MKKLWVGSLVVIYILSFAVFYQQAPQVDSGYTQQAMAQQVQKPIQLQQAARVSELSNRF